MVARRQTKRRKGSSRAPAAPTAARKRFEALTLPHADRLYRYALRLSRQSAEAEDLVQETYLKAWRAFEESRLTGDCRPWLFRVLTNQFINRYRRKRREPILMDLSQAEAYVGARDAGQAAAPALREQLDDRVKAALDALKPEFRIVLLLAAVEGLSYEQIAEVCRIPIGTVMSRLHRGRRQLRRRLRTYAEEMGYPTP